VEQTTRLTSHAPGQAELSNISISKGLRVCGSVVFASGQRKAAGGRVTDLEALGASVIWDELLQCIGARLGRCQNCRRFLERIEPIGVNADADTKRTSQQDR
jgi:hypothetical protein